MSMEGLEHVVATNDKQRFSFNTDKTRIRANQGHSLRTLDLGLQAVEPVSYTHLDVYKRQDGGFGGCETATASAHADFPSDTNRHACTGVGECHPII